MDNISWADRVRNEEVLQRVEEERNFLHTVTRRNANWIGYIFYTNFLLKLVVEEEIQRRIEGKRRRGRRRKHLLDRVNKENRYWNLKEEALDRSVWRTLYGRGYELLVRFADGCQNTKNRTCCTLQYTYMKIILYFSS